MKEFLEKYDVDMLDRMVQSLHARIQSDATTPSKATKEYFEMALKNAITPVETKLDNHIAKEEADNTVIVSFMNDVSPMLKNYKNLQGFWYISSLIFLSISGISVFFFSVKWVVLKLVEHGL